MALSPAPSSGAPWPLWGAQGTGIALSLFSGDPDANLSLVARLFFFSMCQVAGAGAGGSPAACSGGGGGGSAAGCLRVCGRDGGRDAKLILQPPRHKAAGLGETCQVRSPTLDASLCSQPEGFRSQEPVH